MGKKLDWRHVLSTHELVGGDFRETAKLFLDPLMFQRYVGIVGPYGGFFSPEQMARLVVIVHQPLSPNARANRVDELVKPILRENNRARLFYNRRTGVLSERPSTQDHKQQEARRERDAARLRERAPNESPKLYRKRLRRQGA